jgi:hypothetical protein
MNMCCYMYYCMEWFTSLGTKCDAFMHHTRELRSSSLRLSFSKSLNRRTGDLPRDKIKYMYIRRLRMIVPVRGPFYVRVFTRVEIWQSQHLVVTLAQKTHVFASRPSHPHL